MKLIREPILNMTVITAMVLRYRTFINSEPRQDFEIRCETKYGDDYMYSKRLLRGPALLNSRVYEYNWFHCDEFTEYPAPGEDPCAVPTDNLNAGFPLGEPEAAENSVHHLVLVKGAEIPNHGSMDGCAPSNQPQSSNRPHTQSITHSSNKKTTYLHTTNGQACSILLFWNEDIMQRRHHS